MSTAQAELPARATYEIGGSQFELATVRRAVGSLGHLYTLNGRHPAAPQGHILYVDLRAHAPETARLEAPHSPDEPGRIVRYTHLPARARLAGEQFEVSFWVPEGLLPTARPLDGTEPVAADWFPPPPVFEGALVRLCRAVLRVDERGRIDTGAVWADRSGLYLLNAGAFRPEAPGAAPLARLLDVYLRGLFALAGGTDEVFRERFPANFWDGVGPAEVLTLVENGLLREDPGAYLLRRRLLALGRGAAADANADAPVTPEPLQQFTRRVIQAALADATSALARPPVGDGAAPADAGAALDLIERTLPAALGRWLGTRPLLHQLWQALDGADRALRHLEARQQEAVRAAAERLAAAEAAAAATDQQLASAREQADDLSGRLRAECAALETSRRELSRLRLEVAAARVERDKLQEQVQTAQADVDQLRGQLRDAREQARRWQKKSEAGAARADERALAAGQLAEEVAESSGVPLASRVAAVGFTLALVAGAFAGLLVASGDALRVTAQGIDNGRWVFGWAWLGAAACAALLPCALLSPGSLMLGHRLLRVRDGHPPEPLSLTRRLVVVALHYGPPAVLLAAAHGVPLSPGPTPALVSPTPDGPRRLTPAAWLCGGAAGWLALNGLSALLMGLVSGVHWRGAITPIEWLCGVGLAAFPVDRSDAFRALYAGDDGGGR